MRWTGQIALLLGFLPFQFTRIAAQDFDQLMKDSFKCELVNHVPTKSEDSKGSRDDSSSEMLNAPDAPAAAVTRRVFVLSEFHPQLATAGSKLADEIYEEEPELEEALVYNCDWSVIAKRIKFQQMAENLNKSATYWAGEWEKKYNGSSSSPHFVGVGLGAHFWGLVGRKIQASGLTVSRITGLDPVGICFEEASASKCGGKTFLGLKKTDAKYVDVLFTGREFWGFCDPPVINDTMEMCHACYFANGGYHQPGCEGNGDGSNILSACSHNRAVDLYFESIQGHHDYGFNASGCTKGRLGPCDFILNTFGHFTDLESEGIFGFATKEKPLFNIPLICWPEAGSDDGKSTFQDCHISDHYIV